RHSAHPCAHDIDLRPPERRRRSARAARTVVRGLIAKPLLKDLVHREGSLMGDIASFCLLSIAVFCGAFVSGLAGFAFSAVAGAIRLHVLPPLDAVPLMRACRITAP